jgi:hypothetical protein
MDARWHSARTDRIGTAGAWPFAIGLGGCAVLAVVLRLPFYGTPLTVDEGGYAHVARWWGRGLTLYRDTWVDRPQGLLLLYRVTMRALGENDGAIHVLAMATAAGTVVVLGVLVRTVTRSAGAGVLAGGLLAALGSWPRIEGFAANGELLAALPSTASLALFCAACQTDARTRDTRLFAAGLCGAVAVLVKQSGYDGALTVAAVLLVLAVRRRRGRPTYRLDDPGQARGAGRGAFWFAAGLALPSLAALAHGARIGFGDWWFAVAGYRLSVENLTNQGWGHRWMLLRWSLGWVWPVLVPIGVLGTIGALSAFRRRSPERIFVAWFGAALSAFALGGLFHPHYYVGLLAPGSALAAVGVRVTIREARGLRRKTAATIVVLATICPATWFGLPIYRTQGSVARSLAASRDGRTVADDAVAGWLRERTAKDEQIYAMYAAASLYFAADRPAPVKYLWRLGIERIPGAMDELAAVLEGPSPPRFIVVYQPPGLLTGSARVRAAFERRYRFDATVHGAPIYHLVS